MPSFRNRPVKQKLTLLILGTTSAALVVACLAFVFYELSTFKQSMVGKLSALADVLAVNCEAPLYFESRDDAEENLRGVSAEPSIRAAGIYTAGGTLFASYVRNAGNHNLPAHPAGDGAHFGRDRLVLCRPVLHGERRNGTICLEASLDEIDVRLRSYVVISVLVLAGSFLLALLLSAIVQRLVSKPIIDLASTAKRVSDEKDYAIRAKKESEDELGQLTDSFNQMLAGIQGRDTTLVETNNALQEQINARAAAEEQLRELNDQLEQRVTERTKDLQRSNEELEQFAYVASHDLQEPLRMVVSYLQLLERRYKDKVDADGRQFINFAVEGGKRMQGLIQDLLAFSRVGSHANPFAAADASRVLRTVLSNLKLVLEEAGTKVTFDPLPTVICDATQLTQLFQNLISNAIKFRGKEPPHIHLSATREDYEWIFSVHDNGIGIDPQFFDRIFVIFQRLHNRDQYPGTGIGLAVCKKIIQHHGGRIWVKSEPQQGSTFYFTIPDRMPGPA